MVRTILNSGAGILCVSETTVCPLQTWFPGVDIVRPHDDDYHQVVLADRQTAAIGCQTCTLAATILTLWALVAIRLALPVMAREDGSLTLRSKMLCEKLNQNVMKQLRQTTAASGGGVSSMESAPAGVSALPSEVVGMRRVAVIIEVIKQVGDIEVEVARERDRFKNALLDLSPTITMDCSDSEMQQREQALDAAILRAAQADMPPDDMDKIRRLVHYMEAFRRGLTGEPPAQMSRMWLV